MSESVDVRCSATVPGANSNTTVLWTTETLPTAGIVCQHGLSRFSISLKHSEYGTFLTHKSSDRGATWIPVSSETVPADETGATTEREWIISQFDDWKCSWKNGGTAQTTWSVSASLEPEKDGSSVVLPAFSSNIDAIKSMAPSVFYFGLNGTIDPVSAEAGVRYKSWKDLGVGLGDATCSVADDEPSVAFVGSDAALTFNRADTTDGDAFAFPTTWNSSNAFTLLVAFKADTATGTLQSIYGNDDATQKLIFNSGAMYCTFGATYGGFSFTDTTLPHVVMFEYDGSQVGNTTRLICELDEVAKTLSYGGTIPATFSGPSTGTIGRATDKSNPFGGKLLMFVAFNRKVSLTVGDKTKLLNNVNAMLSFI